MAGFFDNGNGPTRRTSGYPSPYSYSSPATSPSPNTAVRRSPVGAQFGMPGGTAENPTPDYGTDYHFPGHGPGPYGSPTPGFPGWPSGNPGTPTPPPNGGPTPPNGGSDPNQPPPPSRTPNYGWLSGYDYNKLMDPTHTSAKYQIGRTLALFDPHLGVTGDVLQALNALGLGTFSGSGDALGLDKVTAAGLAAGLDPHSFMGDFIGGFHSDHPSWTYDAYADPATAAATDPSSGIPVSSGDGGSGSSDAMMANLMAMMAQDRQPAATAPDLSWLGPVLQSLTQGQGGGSQQPSFSGGYVTPAYSTPGYGATGNATQQMALSLSQLLADPRYASDPLAQRILASLGGGR